MSVALRAIDDADATRVGEFLHSRLNARVTAEHWARSLQVPWAVDKPNNGFMLLDGDRVVGVHLAFYSEREIDGRIERFCNLGAFCVLPEYRFHSLRLLKALLAQEGYHFTDLSPSGSVVALNRRLKFRAFETDVALVPNLPWPSWPARDTISSDPDVIERTLTGRDLELYRDNAGGSAGRHLVLIRGHESCYVVFRKERKRRLPLPLFANILHVSNPDLFRRHVRAARAPPAGPARRARDDRRRADRQAPPTPLVPAARTPSEDVPKRAPGAGTDRLPVQRAGLCLVVRPDERVTS